MWITLIFDYNLWIIAIICGLYHNLQIIAIIGRFKKKIDVHPLGPLRTLRKNFSETGFYP